jgi:hypothetical protein
MAQYKKMTPVKVEFDPGPGKKMMTREDIKFDPQSSPLDCIHVYKPTIC